MWGGEVVNFKYYFKIYKYLIIISFLKKFKNRQMDAAR